MTAPAQPPCVLVVDDDDESRAILAEILGRAGYEMVQAQDGRQGLELARRRTPDLIVLDLLMPGMDGWSFRLAQRADPALAHVPVLVLSGDPAPQAAALDADLFLRKPIQADHLVAEVGRLLALAANRNAADKLALAAAVLESQRAASLDGMLVLSGPKVAAYNRRFVAMFAVPDALLASADTAALAAHCRGLLWDPAQIPATLRDAQTPELRDELLLRDGRTFERHSMPVTGAGEVLLGRLIVFRDVSEARKAETALRSSEQRLRTLLSSTSGIMFELDGDGRFLGVWTSRDELLARRREDIVGRTIAEVLGEDQARRFLPTLRTVHDTGRAESVEYAMDVPAGSRWFVACFDRMPGSPATVVVAIRDITDRYLAHLEHQRLAAIVEASNDAMIGLSADGTIEDWNSAAQVIFGYSAAEARGQNVSMLWPADRPDAGRLLDDLQHGRPVINAETVRRHKDGTLVDVALTCSAILDDAGKLARIAATARNITEQKRLRAQLVLADRLASVGTLAAGVAHEINNPLAYVLTNLSYLGEEITHFMEHDGELRGDDRRRTLADMREALDEAQQGARRVQDIVRDLKTFSRGNDAELGPIDLRDVLDATVKMAQNEIRHRAQLVRDYQPVPLVLANEARLGQLFLNLVINAAHAIDEGAADKHEIRVSTGTDAEGRAVVEVSDSGSGIQSEHLGHIFDPFFTTKEVGVGTGLGLSICHGIVTGLGGEIRVASTSAHGTTFRVALPPAPAASRGPAPAAQPAPATARRLRVLFIDDEPALRRSIVRALRTDHEVLTAANGRDALELLAKDDAFDVILSDVMMPEMTGIDLYLALAERRPDLIPRIIFMTGGAFTQRTREFLASVPNTTLSKPFAMAELRALLAKRRG